MKAYFFGIGERQPLTYFAGYLRGAPGWDVRAFNIGSVEKTVAQFPQLTKDDAPHLLVAPLLAGFAPALARLGGTLVMTQDDEPVDLAAAAEAATCAAAVIAGSARTADALTPLFGDRVEIAWDGINAYRFNPDNQGQLMRAPEKPVTRAAPTLALIGAAPTGSTLWRILHAVRAAVPGFIGLTQSPDVAADLKFADVPPGTELRGMMFNAARAALFDDQRGAQSMAAEAMSCGAVVIAPAGSNAAGAFHADVSGFTVDLTNPEQAARRIVALLTSAGRQAIADAGMARARALYWPDATNDRLMRLLCDAIACRRAGRPFQDSRAATETPLDRLRDAHEAALQARRWPEVLAISRAALAAAPSLAWALYGRAVALAALGMVGQAGPTLDLALQADPLDPRIRQAAQRLLAAQKRSAEAAILTAEWGEPSKAARALVTPFDLARRLLTGLGVEIGPMDTPFLLNAKTVKVDVKSREELCALATQYTLYGGSQPEHIAPVQALAAPGDRLPFFCDGSFDFVCNSHVLEHLANPGRAIQEWLRIVRPGGRVFMVVPDKRDCFDRNRADTSVDHLMDEFRVDERRIALEHYQDALLHKIEGDDTGPVDRSPEHIQALYEAQVGHEHVHVFTDQSLLDFLQALHAEIGGFEITYLKRFGMHIAVLLTKTSG